MGQYYKPVSLDKKEYLYTHDFKTKHTRDDGKTFITGEGLKLMEHSYIGNKIMNAVENLIIPGGSWCFTRLVWAGDYADNEKDTEDNINSIMEEKGKKIKPSTKKVDKAYRYLHNHTKKLVIDLSKIKDIEGEKDFKIHPLSLLVCEGNGRGGGDFRGKDPRIGVWARSVISLEKTVLAGYKLIDGNFSEQREAKGITMKSGKASTLKPDMVIGLKNS